MKEKVIPLTVLYVCRGKEKVLLGFKKKARLGKRFRGIWNGFGGGIKSGETIVQAAIREAEEEAGLVVARKDVCSMGVVKARFIDKPGQAFYLFFFRADRFAGEPQETEEMRPQWFLAKDIPFEQMWGIDKWVIPLVLAGRKFGGYVLYSKDRTILKSYIRETKKKKKRKSN